MHSKQEPGNDTRLKQKQRKTLQCARRRQEVVKRLEFEMQRLELEQQLEDMRERMAREKKTRQQDVAHEQWVTEQKRNLQALKIEKVPRHDGRAPPWSPVAHSSAFRWGGFWSLTGVCSCLWGVGHMFGEAATGTD